MLRKGGNGDDAVDSALEELDAAAASPPRSLTPSLPSQPPRCVICLIRTATKPKAQAIVPTQSSRMMTGSVILCFNGVDLPPSDDE